MVELRELQAEGAEVEAAADLAASAEGFDARGLRNLALAQWRAALRTDPAGPAERLLRFARLAAELGYGRDARHGFVEFADRAEGAGDAGAAIEALREYLSLFPDDASVRGRLSELTGEPEPAPTPPLPEMRPPQAAATPADEELEAAAEAAPLPGLVPTAADAGGGEDAGSGDAPVVGLLEGFEPTHGEAPDVEAPGVDAAAAEPVGRAGSERVGVDDDDQDEGSTAEAGALPLLELSPASGREEAEVVREPAPGEEVEGEELRDGAVAEPLPLLGVDEPLPDPGAGTDPDRVGGAGRETKHDRDDRGYVGAGGAPDDYVDFGAMVLADAPDDETRFQVSIGDPTGDEENDFAEILDLFRRNVAERLDPRDAASHYDLGLAFKQMGLLDDAIIHLQSGLRGGADPLATLEVLGECFVQRGQASLAARVFERAARLDGVEEEELVGVLYGLARCQEELGERDAARATLERVVSVDLSFRDAADRLRRLQSG